MKGALVPDLIAEDDEVIKEMFGGSIPRVDVVSGPASGLKFVVLKAGADQDAASIQRVTRALAGDKERVMPIEDATVPVAKAGVVGADPAADLVAGDDEAMPDGDELDAEKTTNADGVGVPTESPGDPDDPESPAWEAVDAARGRQAIELVVALQRLVQMSISRESQEVAVGADDDAVENVYDLSDILDSLDDVLDILAPFAVTEQAEADQRTGEQPVTKSGRSLSGVNEQRIQSAMEALKEVLASLPVATEPEGDTVTTTEAAPVAKSDDAPGVDADLEATEVTKAAGDPLLAVYSQSGKLLGAIDPTKVTPLQTGDPDDGPDDSDEAADDADPSDDASTDEAVDAPPAAPDAPAAPAAEDDAPVAKSQDSPDMESVVKAAIAQAVGAVTEGYAEVVKSLENRVAIVEAQPMPGGPLLSGATGGPEGVPMRGQDLAVSPEIAQVRKSMDEEHDPTKKADLARRLSFLTLRAAYSG